MSNPLLDIRIGTMVRANLSDPAAYVRRILPLGFESIQPFFWQTIGDKDIPRLAASPSPARPPARPASRTPSARAQPTP